METENNTLTEIVKSEDSELKEIVVNFVGNSKNPENDEITVEQIIEVFAEQFPEFLLAVAEENWVNGYTQALNDVEYVKSLRDEILNNPDNNDSDEAHKE